MLTSAKTKWDLFCEQKSIVIWKQQSTKSSTKDVNLGTITDTLSWYQFSPLIGIRVKPKLHRRWRTIYESLQKPSQKPKFMHTNNFSEFGQYCEELSWNHWTSTLHRSETSRIAGRAVRRAKEETSAVLLQSGSDDKWSDSKACYCCLRDVVDRMTHGKSLNEQRFGESFQDMLCSREELGKKIFWLLRLKKWNDGCIRNFHLKTECERSPDNTTRWTICFSLWQMVQQNYQEETTNSQNPLWDGNPP